MQISFRQDRDSKNTVLYLIGRNGETVWTKQFGAVSSKKRCTVSWNGKDDKGADYEGEFRLKIMADGYTTRNWHYYDCYAKSPFLGGTGTRENPYQVASAEHLERMADFRSRHFIQVQDIDLRSELISRIFSAEQPFMGSYNAKPNGQGYRILNYNGNTSLRRRRVGRRCRLRCAHYGYRAEPLCGSCRSQSGNDYELYGGAGGYLFCFCDGGGAAGG